MPRTRRVAGWFGVALFLAVWPANIHVAVSGAYPEGLSQSPLYHALRVPFQLLYVAWAAWVALGRLPGLGIRHRSFHSPKTALPTTGWIVDERRAERRAELRDGRRVEGLLVRRGTRRLLIHHWREGTGGFLPELARSGLGLDWSPLRRTRVPLVVRLATPIPSGRAGVEEGQARLARFEALLAEPLKQIGTPRGTP